MANENFEVPAIAREIGKKKRSNRTARLKQCKLDARREQWLSQGTLFGLPKVDKDPRPLLSCSLQILLCISVHTSQMNWYNATEAILQISVKDGDLYVTSIRKETMLIPPFFCAFAVKKGKEEKAFPASPTSPLQRSPQSKSTKKKRLSPNTPSPYPEEPTNQENDDPEPPTYTSCENEGGTNNGSIGSYSRSVSDAEEDYDWETIADALSASPNSSRGQSPASMEPLTDTNTKREQHGATVSRTWGPDLRHADAPVQSPCPVCYEELDLTDSSFLPCDCGFRICLFCHKRILEADDARCPGCRKPYKALADGEEVGVVARLGGRPLVYRFARSCSLRAGS